MQLHENSVRLWNASKVFVYKYINIKKQRFVKFLLFLHFIATELSKGEQIPHLGCPRMFKVPTSSRGLPPLGHNIDSCINLLAVAAVMKIALNSSLIVL